MNQIHTDSNLKGQFDWKPNPTFFSFLLLMVGFFSVLDLLLKPLQDFLLR